MLICEDILEILITIGHIPIRSSSQLEYYSYVLYRTYK